MVRIMIKTKKMTPSEIDQEDKKHMKSISKSGSVESLKKESKAEEEPVE